MTFPELQELMADVFEVSPTVISEASTPDDIAAWDSLRLLELLLALEKQYGVLISADQIPSLMSVGAILAAANEPAAVH